MAVVNKPVRNGASLRSAFVLQLLGAALPALIMLLAVPMIRTQLDVDRFAGFTVLLSAVGLLAVLDGGLGRASTYFMSLALKSGSGRRAVSVFQGILLVGVSFSLLLALLGGLAVREFNGAAAQAVRPALVVLVGFAPVFVIAALLRGFLEAQHRFAVSSTLQVLYGTVLGLAPVWLFHFTDDLQLLAWTLGLVRLVFTLLLLHACGLLRRENRFVSRTAPVHALRVFGYVKWLFLSNLVGLAIVFADRFLVVSLFPGAVVAAYVLPMEMVSRLQILVNAFCSALFPRLVAGQSENDGVGIRMLADAQGVLLCASLLVCSLGALVAEPLMRWWLGPEAARMGAGVLLIGVIGSGLIAGSALAMLVVNSRGLTRPVALLHLFELPVYLGLLYWAARSSSIVLLLGVWVLRLAVDALVMTQIAFRSAPGYARARFTGMLRGALPWCAVLVGLAAMACLYLQPSLLPTSQQGVALAIGLGTALAAGWVFVVRLRGSANLVRRRVS